ncbi:MAG: hypothetical protein N4A49_13625 [Marinifilaceae bacterium]|jgi:hypothetical protein|nr:hypothetical protein [Marinifilaceae bacterium]
MNCTYEISDCEYSKLNFIDNHDKFSEIITYNLVYKDSIRYVYKTSQNRIIFKLDEYGEVFSIESYDSDEELNYWMSIKYFNRKIFVKYHPQESMGEGYHELEVEISREENIITIVRMNDERGNDSKIILNHLNNKVISSLQIHSDGTKIKYNYEYDTEGRLINQKTDSKEQSSEYIYQYNKNYLKKLVHHNGYLTNITTIEEEGTVKNDKRFFYNETNGKFSYCKESCYDEKILKLFIGDIVKLKLLGYRLEKNQAIEIYNVNSKLLFTAKENGYNHFAKENYLWYDNEGKNIEIENIVPKWVFQLIYPFNDEIDYTESS